MIRFIVFIFLALISVCLAQQDMNRLLEMAKGYEVAPMVEPAWAKRADRPNFTFAWISDLHIRDTVSRDFVRRACNLIRDDIRPNFVLITGDNCGYAETLPVEQEKEPLEVRRQLWFRQFLARELALPYEVIPGDNWPQGFEKVFGSPHRSFDFGGIHFQLAATDISAPGLEGCSVFRDSSWKWIQEDLAANRKKPCIFILHETLVPPTFLEAGRCTALLASSPQVIGALSGHLHLDLDFRQNGIHQLVAPSLGRSHRPAFKILKAFPEGILVESMEWNQQKAVFEKVPKWQKLDIPEQFRQKSAPVSGFQPVNRRELPPEPHAQDQALAARNQEFNANLMNFIIGFGLQKLLEQK